MITGKVIWKSPLKTTGNGEFQQVYYLHDVLGQRLESQEYVYRLVVFNDDILVLSLQEDCYYQISYYAKNINHCLNLRDGQLSFDYVLSQSTQILQL